MSSLKEFQCEICGIVSENPIHWFVIECGDQKLSIIKVGFGSGNEPNRPPFLRRSACAGLYQPLV